MVGSMQGALQTQLSFPKGQARSEGLSKICCIGCQLQAPLFRQDQESTAGGQALLTQAQAPTLVPVPITGGTGWPGAVAAKVGQQPELGVWKSGC